MSQGARRDFYQSKAWKRVRLNVWRKQNCLCFNCGLPCYVDGLSDYIPKEQRRTGIVHHIEHLNEENVFEQEIALDESNLVGLCKDCHEREHHIANATREGLTFDEEGNLVKK